MTPLQRYTVLILVQSLAPGLTLPALTELVEAKFHSYGPAWLAEAARYAWHLYSKKARVSA